MKDQRRKPDAAALRPGVHVHAPKRLMTSLPLSIGEPSSAYDVVGQRYRQRVAWVETLEVEENAGSCERVNVSQDRRRTQLPGRGTQLEPTNGTRRRGHHNLAVGLQAERADRGRDVDGGNGQLRWY